MTWIPRFTRTIRFRLTVLYSALLFVFAALVLGGVYVALSRSVEAQPVSETFQVDKYVRTASGQRQYIGQIEAVKVRQVEEAVNHNTLKNMRRFSYATLGGLMLGSLGIGWVLSGRVLRPVKAITQTANEIQATDLSRRIRLTGPKDELRNLADTIDSMLDRLDTAFTSQRKFIDDASHELRSPLAIIRTNVDAVLASPDATEEERRRASGVVDRATARMTRLVEDLLATARRNAPALDDSDVDLAEVVREAAEEITPLAVSHGLIIRQETRTGLTVIADHDALRRALGNLLSNAVRVAPRGSPVTVAAGRTDGWLWTAVKDAGPGISDADQAHVFDRFWRGAEPSRQPDREPQGREPEGEPDGQRADRRTGLGLAIVRQIVEAHGGQVRLSSRVGMGSTFILWLPAPSTDERGQPPETDPLG